MSPGRGRIELTASTISRWFLGAALALALVLALAVGYYAMPLNDDWTRASSARNQQPLAYAAAMYRTWFGRWFASAIQIAALQRVDVYTDYPWLLLGLGSAQLLALRALAGRLVIGSGRAWLAAGSALALLWCCTPHTGEYWYWFIGGAEYSLSVSLGIVVVSLASAERTSLLLVSCLGALLVSGLHELSGATTVVALAAGSWTVVGRERKRWLLVLGFALLGLAINVAAPGNAVRQQQEHVQRGLGVAFYAIRWNLYHEVCRWLIDPKPWLATALLGSWFATARTPYWRLAPDRLRWAAPVATVISGCVWAVAAPVMAGFRFNDRSASACHAAVFVGWLVTLWAWAPSIRSAFSARVRPGVSSISCALLGILVLATGNAALAARSLPQTIPAWRAGQLERHRVAMRAAAAGISSVSFTAALSPPALYMQDDITSEPDDRKNHSFARLHGLEAVSAPVAH